MRLFSFSNLQLPLEPPLTPSSMMSTGSSSAASSSSSTEGASSLDDLDGITDLLQVRGKIAKNTEQTYSVILATCNGKVFVAQFCF